MLADICDADHIESGSERMGLYFSFLQVSTKFGAGLSIFVGFSLLTVIGFDAEAGKDNSAEALRNLRYLMVGLPGLAYAIVSIILLKYPISRENQQEMRSIIEEREKRSLERL
jgi:Na+/melibiose symporter-like transporter